MKKFFIPLFIVFISVYFCGCPAELKITPNTDGTFSAEFNSGIGEKLTSALKDLNKASAQLSETPSGEFDLTKFIDSKKVQNELNASCFNGTQVKIQKNANGTAYTFNANAKTKAALPQSVLAQTKTSSGKTRVTLNLGPEILQATLLKDKTTLKTFADVLMAPLITGEDMTVQEYRELLTDVYGASVTQELLSGDFKITIVSGGKSVSQSIPVAELLAISSPRTFVFEY